MHFVHITANAAVQSQAVGFSLRFVSQYLLLTINNTKSACNFSANPAPPPLFPKVRGRGGQDKKLTAGFWTNI